MNAAALPSTRLTRRPRRGSAWTVGVVVTLAMNVAVVLGLSQVSQLARETTPAPLAVQRFTRIDVPTILPDPPLSEATLRPREDQTPPPPTINLPALELAPLDPVLQLHLPAMPPIEHLLPTLVVPAYATVGADPQPGRSAPDLLAVAPLAFDEPPRLLAAIDLARFYPRQARVHGVEGTSRIRLALDATGAVTGVEVVNSEPKGTFDEAVIRLGRSLAFAPARRAGTAVAGVLTLDVAWKLER